MLTIGRNSLPDQIGVQMVTVPLVYFPLALQNLVNSAKLAVDDRSLKIGHPKIPTRNEMPEAAVWILSLTTFKLHPISYVVFITDNHAAFARRYGLIAIKTEYTHVTEASHPLAVVGSR